MAVARSIGRPSTQEESCSPARFASSVVLRFSSSYRRGKILHREISFEVVLKQAHADASRHGLEVDCFWYSSGFGRTGVLSV